MARARSFFRVHERGQAAPLLLVLLGAAIAAALLVGAVGGAASRRARAQTAADAAALAGAAAGEQAAAALAEANGAALESFAVDGAVVTVAVVLDDARATASAERAAPVDLAPPGGGDRSRLAPAMLAALARADVLLGRPVPVVDGTGLEIVVAEDVVLALAAVGTEAGLCRLQGPTRHLHFEACLPSNPE